MSSALKTLLVLALLGAAAWFAFGIISGDDRPEPGPTPVDTAEPRPDDRPEPIQPMSTPVEEPRPRDREVVRQAVDDRPANSADAPQGVRGTVVDSQGRPIAGAQAFLFEGQGQNLFETMMKMQRGVTSPPIASAETEADGSFALGIRQLPEGATWELRVVDERHADATRPNLTVFAEQWHDAGRIELPDGIEVQGRVTRLDTGAPVVDGYVVFKPTTNTLVLGQTPGREEGITVRTDGAGNYLFRNATPGVASIAAYASGCARVELAHQQVQAGGENRFDFELPPGLSIAGIVTDGEGEPVANARVQVLAISAKNPLTVDTRSDRDGRFEALGLVDGPYQVIVTSPGYVRADVKPVMAGKVDEHVVLESQGTCRVKVVAQNAKLVNRYTIYAKSYHAEQEAYGNLMHVAPMEVGPRDLEDGYYRVGGLDPGTATTYALEIHAKGYAKAYSQPFTIAIDAPEPEIVVTVSAGGGIRGIVVGPDGKPLPNVRISTFPNDWEDNALADMFKGMIPYKITKADFATKRDGRFEFEHLAPGTYQLRFAHPRHYSTSTRDIAVEEGRVTELQPVTMMQGTLVVGTVTVDGAPAGQVKVQISAVPDPRGETSNTFSATAVTDDQGRFEIPKRLPPGTYTAHAGRQTNPFQMIVDYQQTKQEFVVGQGVPQYQLSFRIVSQ